MAALRPGRPHHGRCALLGMCVYVFVRVRVRSCLPVYAFAWVCASLSLCLCVCVWRRLCASPPLHRGGDGRGGEWRAKAM